MISSTRFLHNAVRSGTADCMCPEWTKMERVVTHLPGCWWAVYVNEIYRLERAAEAEPDIKIRGPFGSITKKRLGLDGTPSGE